MNLFVNMLIEWQTATGSWIERLLWIDPSGTDAAIIEILNPQSLPIFHKCKDIEAAITSGEAHVLEVDPYATLLRSEDSIPKKHLQHRDAAWEVIMPLIEDKTGQSVVEKLQEEIIKFSFILTKHTNKSAEDWGAKLYKKTKEIMNL